MVACFFLTGWGSVLFARDGDFGVFLVVIRQLTRSWTEEITVFFPYSSAPPCSVRGRRRHPARLRIYGVVCSMYVCISFYYYTSVQYNERNTFTATQVSSVLPFEKLIPFIGWRLSRLIAAERALDDFFFWKKYSSAVVVVTVTKCI